jgi:hypothetical protein
MSTRDPELDREHVLSAQQREIRSTRDLELGELKALLVRKSETRWEPCRYRQELPLARRL